MGQKVDPIGLRLGINKDWEAKWYASKTDFSKVLANDLKIACKAGDNSPDFKILQTGSGIYRGIADAAARIRRAAVATDLCRKDDA